jgi:hypothetical protein
LGRGVHGGPAAGLSFRSALERMRQTGWDRFCFHAHFHII